ncbi:phosphatidylinositol-specific phospholipase C/glycerophosphodiester phosphodiesterase family protein [Telluribacter sp. SYSU D00476]|uniref:phosphatidylinositol-specific phospholipase C/glycerophosphodiester phosphodiesterase family protein n=1 Tax=Telluribacter sp. SYSU D00476 TaxID=2811430 RepID=UPI001FF627F2|nr:phosphatidylinositol-specific phospholipase C/glycerophosphodiester phosphodiesterase family protein [Telluribacter sp. SYSU D00476]
MKLPLLSLLTATLLYVYPVLAQSTIKYTTAQAHSHNDYEQAEPFWKAYNQQYGSIEADLILRNDTLYTAHDLKDISPSRTFASLYLNPILAQIKKNGGSIYTDKNTQLQLLIDFKTPAEPTMTVLIRELAPHADLLAPKGSVRIVISGNTPAPEHFGRYPDYISFDGRPNITYTPQQLERVGLISQSFRNYSRWNGTGTLPEPDRAKLQQVIQQAHAQGKKFRLWATPDTHEAWATLKSLNADFINTDKVVELADYLRK